MAMWTLLRKGILPTAALLLLATMLWACGGNGDGTTDLAGDPGSPDDGSPPPLSFTVVTFNTGTTESKGDEDPDDAYTPEMATWSDQYYGNGLSWMPAVQAAKDFLASLDPDIVAFQEIFSTTECANVPVEARDDFFCQDWQDGNPTVAQAILPEGWQVACNMGKPDKCAAINPRFGRFRGCDTDFCLEGMDGARVMDCGGGSRVGRAVVDLVAGGTLTLVNVHGSSGIKQSDHNCRRKQFAQVFEDFGGDFAGQPAANGERNVILGDFNTDPGRFAKADVSAAYLIDKAGGNGPFHFVTAVGPDVTPTYGGFVNIDHVISDAFVGNCWAAGVDPGHPAVLPDAAYFDHTPVVCVLGPPVARLD